MTMTYTNETMTGINEQYPSSVQQPASSTLLESPQANPDPQDYWMAAAQARRTRRQDGGLNLHESHETDPVQTAAYSSITL